MRSMRIQSFESRSYRSRLSAMLHAIHFRYDPVLDQTLKHFELVLVKPREAAETAAVGLNQINAVKSSIHRIFAFGTGKERVGFSFECPELPLSNFELVFFEHRFCERFYPLGTGMVPARSCQDSGNFVIVDQDSRAETALVDLGPFVRFYEKRVLAGRAGKVLGNSFFR